MQRINPRFLRSSIRAGLLVALAGLALALTPRPGSATVLVCNGAGVCITLGNSCEYWSVPAGYTCFTLGPMALKDPHLFQDGDGGASLVNDGKTYAVMSDAADRLLQRAREAGTRAGTRVPLGQQDFDAAFRSADRRVGDARLQVIGRELGLRIEPRSAVPNTALPQVGAGGAPSRTPQLTRSTAAEIETILDGNRFERETAGFMVQMLLNHQGGVFPGYKKGGGWCWNDDGTFYGPLPCPTTARVVSNTTIPSAGRVAQPQPSPTARPSRAAATEMLTFLERSTLSRDAIIALVILFLKDQPGLPSGYHQSGGWCWKDNWDFYGPLPCPRVKE